MTALPPVLFYFCVNKCDRRIQKDLFGFFRTLSTNYYFSFFSLISTCVLQILFICPDNGLSNDTPKRRLKISTLQLSLYRLI